MGISAVLRRDGCGIGRQRCRGKGGDVTAGTIRGCRNRARAQRRRAIQECDRTRRRKAEGETAICGSESDTARRPSTIRQCRVELCWMQHHTAYAVVFRVSDEKISGWIVSYRVWTIEHCSGGGAPITAKARCVIAHDRG